MQRRKSDWEDEEYRRKTTDGIRRTQKELWKNEKHREKMITIRTNENGPYKSQEFRDKMSKCTQGENNPMFGVHRYRENAPNRKQVIRLSDGYVYSCIADAAEDNGVSTQTIRKRCKTRKDFMYYNEWLTQQNDC